MRRLAVVCFAALLSCGDGGAPTAIEPSGEYDLQSVNEAALPFVVARYLDGTRDEISNGSLRVLSRGRLIVTATMDRRAGNGSLQREIFDTVTFPYTSSGDLVVLSFQDQDGVRADTLQLVGEGESWVLLALSDNYRRPTRPITLVKGARYWK